MNKHLRVKDFLMTAVAVAALFGTAALYARPAAKVHICHFPPGNPDNVQALTISANALKTHEDHHDDYLVDSPDECYAGGAGVGDQGGASVVQSFAVQVCINRSGEQEGRKIKTSLTGLISSSRTNNCGS